MTTTLLETKRRDPNLRQYKVEEVVPAYFQESYPNLISFLSSYYDAIYANGDDTAIGIIPDLFAIRDLDEINLKYIDRLFYEIANDSQSKYFNDPRLIGKFFHQIIQNKGNEYGTQLFFRAFFNETPQIVYPKHSLFTTNVSKLNDQHVLQNGKKWQILSVLIRSGTSIIDWETLYRKYAHTAGYYLSGEVVVETIASINTINEDYFVSIGDSAIAKMPISIADSGANSITLELMTAESMFVNIGETILEINDREGYTYLQYNLPISKISDITIDVMNSQYNNIGDIFSFTSPTLDNYPTIEYKSINMSNSVETMDMNKHISEIIEYQQFIPSGHDAFITLDSDTFVVRP